MSTPLRIAAVFAFALAAVSNAQPTLERTSCLRHPESRDRGGIGLSLLATDWNDDGADDLVVGMPWWDYTAGSKDHNGRLDVYRWDVSELSGWDLLGMIVGAAESQLGRAIAAGDFDEDFLSEFAVSAPFEGGGKVFVRGTDDEGGCCSSGGIDLVQGTNGISGSSEPGDALGHSLATGDFDGDFIEDLAVGVIGESWAGVDGSEQGAVHVFYGVHGGLDGARDLLFGQNSFGQTREDQDHFGQVLAAGDLDGDGYDDLAIGVPDENEGALLNSGIVHVVFGSASGLDFERIQNWTQSSSGIDGSPESEDQFGASLAIGDFDADGHDDLAIGVPFEHDGDIEDAGAVHVLYSGASGPWFAGSRFFLRPGGSVANAAFGLELLAADLDHDGSDDLVIGSPGATYATPPDYLANGEVHLYFGRDDDYLRSSGLAPWRGTAGSCFNTGDANEQFGSALAAGDFDDDGRIDLAIGISGWSATESNVFEGAVEILFGSDALFRDGFDTGDSGRWSAVSP